MITSSPGPVISTSSTLANAKLDTVIEPPHANEAVGKANRLPVGWVVVVVSVGSTAVVVSDVVVSEDVVVSTSEVVFSSVVVVVVSSAKSSQSDSPFGAR